MVPFWGTLNIRCRITIGTPKGAIILTITHIHTLLRSLCNPYVLQCCNIPVLQSLCNLPHVVFCPMRPTRPPLTPPRNARAAEYVEQNAYLHPQSVDSNFVSGFKMDFWDSILPILGGPGMRNRSAFSSPCKQAI